MTKKEQISSSLKATREKRKSQDCKVFEIKVDKSHLSKATCEQIKRVFLESKWLYNYTLAQENVFDADDKIKEVEIKVKDVFEKRELTIIGSQIKQSVLDGLTQNIKNLSKAKKKGISVGKLNFINRYDSIDLKQFGNTYKIKGSRIKIQGISQWFRVRGLNQIEGYEIANAKFIQKSGDYYLHITCYKKKEEQAIKTKRAVGIDFGIKTQLTLSDGLVGVELNYASEFPKRLRKLYRRWSKKEKHSANWYKKLEQINREFNYWTNKKKDTRNKIINILEKNFGIICYQNDNFRGWQRIWGRRMLSTGIGGITARLKKSATSVQVDRFFASTKTCSCCHHKQNVGLEERTFVCEKCGFIAPRDFNSGTNILQNGLNKIGVEYTEYTPAEMESSALNNLLEKFKAIPRLKVSSVAETGSLVPLGMR
jgi:transposase